MFRCRSETDLDDLAALDEVAEEDGEADDAHAGEAPAPDDLSIHLPETREKYRFRNTIQHNQLTSDRVSL